MNLFRPALSMAVASWLLFQLPDQAVILRRLQAWLMSRIGAGMLLYLGQDNNE